jgi:hypothetical protein
MQNFSESLVTPLSTSVKHNLSIGFTALLLAASYSQAALADYAEPETRTLLEKTSTRPERVATGGFGVDLKIFYSFGTFTQPLVSSGDIKKMLGRNSARVSNIELFRNQIIESAQDPFVFAVIKSFLDGRGRLLAANTGGHYRDVPVAGDPEKALIINVGLMHEIPKPNTEPKYLSESAIRETLVHEMLHYALDKIDAPISETRDMRGLDHFLIEALQDRFTFFDLIRQGKYPLEVGVPTLQSWRQFHKGESIETPEFVKSFVDGQMESPIRYSKFDAERFLKEMPEYPRAPLTDSQLAEVEFLWAYNAVLIRSAALFAKSRKPQKPQDAFKDKETRKQFFSFAAEFAKALETEKVEALIVTSERLLTGLSNVH